MNSVPVPLSSNTKAPPSNDGRVEDGFDQILNRLDQLQHEKTIRDTQKIISDTSSASAHHREQMNELPYWTISRGKAIRTGWSCRECKKGISFFLIKI